jgi:hypothetical protein
MTEASVFAYATTRLDGAPKFCRSICYRGFEFGEHGRRLRRHCREAGWANTGSV